MKKYKIELSDKVADQLIYDDDRKKYYSSMVYDFANKIIFEPFTYNELTYTVHRIIVDDIQSNLLINSNTRSLCYYDKS